MISTSALSIAVQNQTHPDPYSLSKAELFDHLDGLVDGVIDNDTELQYQVSSILDFTQDRPILTRKGLGWETAIAWGVELN